MSEQHDLHNDGVRIIGRLLVLIDSKEAALAEAVATIGKVREALDIPHLAEVAAKRATERACENPEVEDSGEICSESCESMFDYCDPCLWCALLGTIEDAAALLAKYPKEVQGE